MSRDGLDPWRAMVRAESELSLEAETQGRGSSGEAGDGILIGIQSAAPPP